MISKEKKKLMCVGCYNNFYNCGGVDGSTKECWSLSKAKVQMKKFVPIWMVPPWTMPAQKTLSCFHKKGYVAVGKGVTC